MTEKPARFRVTTELTVYFSDCDPMGHCNNARFFTFMEQSRVAYYKRLKALDLRTMDPHSSLGFILAEASCTFHSPAQIDETLVVGVRTSEMRTRSFIMEYEMREKRSRRLVATGRTAQVMFDYKEKKSYPIPASLRRKIEALERRGL